MLRALLSLLLALSLRSGPTAEASDFAARHFARGVEARAKGDLEGARAAFARVLERDEFHLGACAELASLAQAGGDRDQETWYLHRFLDLARRSKDLPAAERERRRALERRLAEVDARASKLGQVASHHLGRLLELGGKALKERRFHAAFDIFSDVLRLDAAAPEARAGIGEVRHRAGNELAIEDPFAGEDPLAGVSEAWIAAEDAKHASWETAWEKETANYAVRTNAGYVVLETTAAVMEQMNRFYRTFYRYQEDGGKTPRCKVFIHKDREEFMRLGSPPQEWAGGYFAGDRVVTHAPGENGSTMEMYRTLFHEASHQFVSLAGGGGVPTWLNEGLASFFEGARILSNKRVEWNLVAPGRLLGLAESLRTSPKSIEDVIRSRGSKDYGPEFYPYGWGLVYFLYNEEDENGRLVYRDLLDEYFKTYREGDGEPVARFADFFVARAKVPGVQTLEAFEARWRATVERWYREYTGTLEVARELETRGDAALARGDLERARVLYDRALEKDGGALEVLWKKGKVLDEIAKKAKGEGRVESADRAAAAYRRYLGAAEIAAALPAERRDEARRRVDQLDATAAPLARARTELATALLDLAREYRDAGLPRMALETARRVVPIGVLGEEARTLYATVEKESGCRLERWRVVFNETDLDGWYNGGGPNPFAVDGGRLTGVFEDPAASRPVTGEPQGKAKGAAVARSLAYRLLFLDRDVAGDYSITAEMRGDPSCALLGFCFGAKSFGLFQAVVMHPGGNLDLSSFDGGWKIGKRLSTGKPTSDWRRLRIDVRGRDLTVRLDDEPVARRTFGTLAELRGELGILVGPGTARFREIRLWELDFAEPGLERARGPAVDPGAAEPTTVARAEAGALQYEGAAPPELAPEAWLFSEPITLDSLLGRVVVLGFCTSYQEERVKFLPALEKIATDYDGLDVSILLVTDERAETAEPFFGKLKRRFPVALDRENGSFAAYRIKEHELPYAMILDVDGTVVWEGHPDWNPELGSYLDPQMKGLAEVRKLREAAAAREKLAEAGASADRGELRAAFALYREIAAVDSTHPVFRKGKAGCARLEGIADAHLRRARMRAGEGRRGAARALLGRVQENFPSTAAAAKAAEEAAALDLRAEDDRAAATRFAQAIDLLEKGDAARARARMDEVAKRFGETEAGLDAKRVSASLAAGADAKSALERHRGESRARALLDEAEELSDAGRDGPAAEAAARALELAPEAPFAGRARALAATPPAAR